MDAAERDALVASHWGLAHKIAAQLHAGSVLVQRMGTLEDVTQECLVALMYAAPRFNPDLGWRFTTYAAAVMKRVIMREARQKALVRIPEGTWGGRKKLSEEVREDIERVAAGVSRLSGDYEQEDRTPPPPLEPDEIEELYEALSRLHAVDRDALCDYFGLSERQELTIKQMAAKRGRTRARVEQILSRARSKLAREILRLRAMRRARCTTRSA